MSLQTTGGFLHKKVSCDFNIHLWTLSPLPLAQAEIVWCQEEPMNMGAWTYVQPRIETALRATTKQRAVRPLYCSGVLIHFSGPSTCYVCECVVTTVWSVKWHGPSYISLSLSLSLSVYLSVYLYLSVFLSVLYLSL